MKEKHLRAFGNRYECHARGAKELSEQFQAFSTQTTLRGLNFTQTRILPSLLENAGWVTEMIKINSNNKLTTEKTFFDMDTLHFFACITNKETEGSYGFKE